MEVLPENIKPILRNNVYGSSFYNDAYESLGNGQYRNIRTGKVGEVSDEQAKNVFTISVGLSLSVGSNVLVLELIQRLGLRFDSVVQGEKTEF